MGDWSHCVANLKDEADIVVVGSCLVEFITYVQTLPKPEETVKGYHFEQRFSGKGANQCVAAAKLRASVALISKLGNDKFGISYLEELRKYNSINTKYIWLLQDVTTGVCSKVISNKGTHQTNIIPGANTYLSASDIDAAKNLLLKAKVIMFQGETPWETTLYCLSKLHVSLESRAKIIVNPSPAVYPLNPIVMILADIICINEQEAEIITDMKINNEEDLADCMEKLLDMKCNTVIITLGGSGVVYATRDNPRLKTITVDHVEYPIESEGVGDCFVGALAYYLCYFPQLPLGEMILRSCHVARQSLFNVGLQNSFPDKETLPDNLFSPKCELNTSNLLDI
ncbi:hypothetical protein M8J75_001985 [Diaphorina citri]|nr:hypothetical protein M8J75_001985 [Diaphorina citri]